MKETFEAVYERGLLRPLRKIAAREGERIVLSVETAPAMDDAATARYDFSDLAGQLVWDQDPLVEQKKLRDEWN